MGVDVLTIGGVSKAYGALKAVGGVAFTVQAGTITGLLGPNGAGKTTTISMIAGLVRPDAGKVLLGGRPIGGDDDPVKQKLGLVPQDLALYDELTAEQNLQLFGGLYGLRGAGLEKAMAETLGLVGLGERRSDKVGTFSGGMKRRLNLAAALLHDPDILLLDEPTVGVDPQSRNAIFDNLETLRGRGKALLYTTHYMEEVERLCDQIIIMDKGKVMAAGTLASLCAMVGRASVLELEGPGAGAIDGLRGQPGVQWVESRGEAIRVGLDELERSAAVLEWLRQAGSPVTHLRSERPNLEAVFLSLTGRSLRDQ
jgi:ABC-2 type transport system ATP-binding protein